MARRPRAARLETRTARLKLPVRKKPYDFTSIAPRIRLGYRRCKGAGTSVVKVADGHGGHWTKGRHRRRPRGRRRRARALVVASAGQGAQARPRPGQGRRAPGHGGGSAQRL